MSYVVRARWPRIITSMCSASTESATAPFSSSTESEGSEAANEADEMAMTNRSEQPVTKRMTPSFAAGEKLPRECHGLEEAAERTRRPLPTLGWISDSENRWGVVSKASTL